MRMAAVQAGLGAGRASNGGPGGGDGDDNGDGDDQTDPLVKCENVREKHLGKSHYFWDN